MLVSDHRFDAALAAFDQVAETAIVVRRTSILALEQGKIDAYVTDGILLAGLAAKAKNPKDYEVVGDFFSKDPYSCMVPENDSKWRDFVNHTLMELIDNGKYFELYEKWFGERGVIPYPMSDQVRNYMIMQSMPE